jgi:TonB family protein
VPLKRLAEPRSGHDVVPASFRCALLLAGAVGPAASASDALSPCSPMPTLVRFSQPEYPPDIEPRGLPNPVSIVVEFTVTPDGRASDPLVLESDAGAYGKEFNARAILAVATWRFERIPKPCRGRIRVIFKIAD